MNEGQSPAAAAAAAAPDVVDLTERASERRPSMNEGQSPAAAAAAAAPDVVDLTGEDERVGGGRSPKRARQGEPPSAADRAPLSFLALPGGVLDDSVLGRVDAIAQQSNCVGCDGRGLAEGVAKKLPYGCSYADRRRMPPQNKFAVPEDRAQLGGLAASVPRVLPLPCVPARMFLFLFAQHPS